MRATQNSLAERLKRDEKLDSIIAQVNEIERVYGWGIHHTNLIFSDLLDDVKSLKDDNYEPGKYQIDVLDRLEEANVL